MELILHTDGGSRGNPGPGGIGVVLSKPNGDVIKEVSKYIGTSTNNEAEYIALIEGLKTANKSGGTNLSCYIDSELVVKQLKGEYKVKNERMHALWTEAKKLESTFPKVTYIHVKREKNKNADRLVNEALDAYPMYNKTDAKTKS